MPESYSLTVNGLNFSPFATLDVNSAPIVPLTISPTQITFAMPPSVPCAATLRVRNPDGVAATFTFNPTPTVTSTVNSTGPSTGGTNFIVIGTGFAAGTTATVNGVPATIGTAAATVVTMTTPPGSPGPVPVVITTPGGCQVTTTFTYL